ncbi:DUF2203 domain-containing protein [candidate division KSB1 bacterium]
MTPGIIYTLSEARKKLKEIRPLIEELVRLYHLVEELGYNIYRHHYFTGQPANGQKYHEHEIRIVQIIEELAQNNILVKAIERGLIDFPSRRKNGEDIYLCWHLGEDDIMFWHGKAEGFMGRKPVKDL